MIAGGRPSKFLYSGKNKKIDPWGNGDSDHENGIELALQPKNKFLKTKDTRSSPGNNVVVMIFLCKLFCL